LATLMLLRSSERAARRGQGQMTLTYALEREQAVGEAPQLAGGSAQDQHLETVVSVEVDVGGGDDFGVSVVLYLHQPAGQIRLVMSVHKRKHTYGRACLQFRFGQSASHQVADCLRAGPAGLPEKGLKPGQQFRFHRDTDPHRAGIFVVVHGVTHCRIVTPAGPLVKRDGAV